MNGEFITIQLLHIILRDHAFERQNQHLSPRKIEIYLKYGSTFLNAGHVRFKWTKINQVPASSAW